MVKGFLKFTEKTLIYQMVTLFLFFCFPFLTFSLCGFGGRYIFNFILYVVLFFFYWFIYLLFYWLYIYMNTMGRAPRLYWIKRTTTTIEPLLWYHEREYGKTIAQVYKENIDLPMVTLFLFFLFLSITFSLCGLGGRYIFNFILYVVFLFLYWFIFIYMCIYICMYVYCRGGGDYSWQPSVTVQKAIEAYETQGQSLQIRLLRLKPWIVKWL